MKNFLVSSKFVFWVLFPIFLIFYVYNYEPELYFHFLRVVLTAMERRGLESETLYRVVDYHDEFVSACELVGHNKAHIDGFRKLLLWNSIQNWRIAITVGSFVALSSFLLERTWKACWYNEKS